MARTNYEPIQMISTECPRKVHIFIRKSSQKSMAEKIAIIVRWLQFQRYTERWRSGGLHKWFMKHLIQCNEILWIFPLHLNAKSISGEHKLLSDGFNFWLKINRNNRSQSLYRQARLCGFLKIILNTNKIKQCKVQ